MVWNGCVFKMHQSNPNARDAWRLAIFPSIQYKVGVLEKKNAWMPPSYPEITLRQFTLIKRNHICANLLFGDDHVESLLHF